VTDSTNRSVTFQLEADDYIAANRLHTRALFRRPLVLAWFAVIVLASAVFIYFSWVRPPETPLDFVVTLVVMCAIAAPLLSYLLYLPYKTRKVFREQKNLHYPLTVSWSADGFKTENQHGCATTPWDDFFKWFHMLPKRVLSEAQLTDMRRFITAPRI
jgi:hypothetical protein